MRHSPKDLIEKVERLNIDHQDVTVYVETTMEIDGHMVPVLQRCEGFYMQGEFLIITSREGV